MKTGKEEIVGLLVALERYADRDEAAETARWTARRRALAAGLAEIPGLTVRADRAQAGRSARPDDDRAPSTRSPSSCRRSSSSGAFAARDPIVMVGDHEADGDVLPRSTPRTWTWPARTRSSRPSAPRWP